MKETGMNIEHLREFIILAQTGHYLEAANRLYISQSTLSKHIKALETELEVPLFNRTTRKVELSSYGKLLLPYAQQITRLQNEYSAAILNSIEDQHKHICIGAIPALAPYGITDLLVRFKREHPGFTLTIMQEGSTELKELLRTEKIELAFIREPNRPKDEFVRMPYKSDTLAAVLPISHPLAACEGLQVSQLQGEDFVMIAQNTMLHDMSIQVCVDSGFTPNVVYTDHKIENIIDLVAKGMGVGILTRPLADHIPNEGVAVVDLLPKVKTYIDVCYRKDTELSIAAKHFIQCVERYKKEEQ